MNLPSGLVFYLDFKYGTALNGKAVGDSLGGKTGPNSPSGSAAPYGEGGFYGVGQYGYSDGSSSMDQITFGQSNAAVASASFKDIDFDSELSASSLGSQQLWKVTASLSGLTRPDELAVRAYNISQSNSTGARKAVVLPQFNRIENGVIHLIISSSGVDSATGSWDVEYPKQPTAATRGDFEDRAGNATEDTLNIPEVNLELRSLPIVAKTRKLKAVWSPELAQDLNAYHSIDAEAELTSMLSDYISMEIDLEILDMLIADAQTVDFWSAKSGEDYDASTRSFVNNTFYGTRFEWYQTLVSKIQKVSNEIHRLTLRGGANFVVVAPKVATILESLPGYVSQPGDGGNDQFSMGISKIGQAAGRYTVYKNPYMTENSILVGFRGSNFLETGAVYSPYVPLITTPLVYDPSDFTPRKGVMTRYAKKMIRPEFYGLIHCKSLDLV